MTARKAAYSRLRSVSIGLSAGAARRILELTRSEGPGIMLRLAVNGGGCSGFQYDYAIVHERHADDLAIEKGGVVVLIDETSLPFLEGAEIDYAEELIGAAFKIKNPNATSNCGCGVSFSV